MVGLYPERCARIEDHWIKPCRGRAFKANEACWVFTGENMSVFLQVACAGKTLEIMETGSGIQMIKM